MRVLIIIHSHFFKKWVEPPAASSNVIKGEAGSITLAQFCLDALTVDDFPYIGQSPLHQFRRWYLVGQRTTPVLLAVKWVKARRLKLKLLALAIYSNGCFLQKD
jgi:hypothetical protein